MPVEKGRPALALHGGAGTLRREDISAADERAHREALESALDEGWKRLEAGEPALDAVEATVRVLEDCPLFNAGRGSVLNSRGEVEMDAALMCGRTLKAGAVAAVRGVRNPVTLTRRIVDDQRFVFLAGHGAEAFARELGLPFETADYFITQRRREQLAHAQQTDSVVLDHVPHPPAGPADDPAPGKGPIKFGTVGAVALDLQGDLAAATSTGGLTNKRFGRIGDTPVVGAGTYADNRGCAVSCTGIGEAFIRLAVGHELSARVRLLGASLEEAAAAVMQALDGVGGHGGFIAVDASGHIAMPFNTAGMYRAWRTRGGGQVQIYA